MPARFDTLPGLAPAKKTASGFLRVQGFATRAGIFTYRQKDGSLRRELRRPEEVFRTDSLDTIVCAPVTLNHPTTGFVTPATVRELGAGSVSNPTVQGDMVRVDILITDPQAIAAAESGIKSLSLGYTTDLTGKGGEWRGQRYDDEQTNIVINHLALVAAGRAGPDAKIRLDGIEGLDAPAETCDDEVVTPPAAPETKRATVKIRLDNVEHDVPDAAAPAIEKLQARADALAEENTTLKAKTDPVVFNAAVAAQAKLVSDARSVFGADAARFDSVTDPLEIKRAILAKLCPALVLGDKTPAYIDARFDIAMESRAAATVSRADLATATVAAGAAQVAAAAPAPAPDDAARQRMLARARGEGTV